MRTNKLQQLLSVTLLLVSLSYSVFSQVEKAGFIVGQVTEKVTGQPLEGIEVSAGGFSAKTDALGNYRLEVPAGNYNLRFSGKGFADFLTGQISVTAKFSFVQNVQMSIVLGEEKVEVKSDVFASTDERPLSQTSLNREEIRNTPGSGGDILRSINSLPSVTSLSAEFGDYIVRGGTTEENLVFIDNIPVADFTLFSDKYDNGKGGRAAVLASDVIQRADFSAGGFGARYGDKMSSVLDIGLRESNRDKFQGVVFVDSGGAGTSLEIPFGKRGGWLTSVRRSYIDVAFDIAQIGDIGRPRNWDFINKGIYDLNTRNKLSFTAINSFETFTLTPEQASASDRRTDRLETDRRLRRAIAGLTLSTAIDTSTLSQVTAWINGQHVDGSLFRLDLPKTAQRSRDLRDFQFGVKEELTASISKKLQLAAGGGVIFDQAKYFNFEKSGFWFSPLEEEYNRPDRTSLFNLGTKTSAFAYGQLTWRPTPRFSLTPAIRIDRYGLTSETQTSPRFSARFTATEKISLNFATGIYRQQPGLFTLAIARPNVLQPQLRAQRAVHVVGGIEWLVLEDLRIRAEVFAKRYDNLIGQAVFPLGQNIFDNNSSGYANGIEISMQKALSGRWAGQLSYSFMNSKRSYSGSSFEFPSDNDRPHQFTAIGITRLFKFTVAAKYRLASGTPYSNRTAIRPNPGINFFLQRLVSIQDINALRLTRYSNLDARAERKFDFKRWSIAPYLDVFNIFVADNKSQVNYEFNRRNPIFLGENARIPIFGLRVEF